jgi:zinc transporter
VSVELGYGSDKNGIIWAYRFEAAATAREIDADGCLTWLAGGAEFADSFVWLHLSKSNVASEPWLRRHIELPEVFFDAMRTEGVSTRVEREEDFLIAVIHDVLFESSFDSSDVSTVYMCIGPRILVSVRRKPLRSVDRLRRVVKSGKIFASSASLLGELLRDQANVLVEILRDSTTRVDSIENTFLNDRISVSRRDLGSLRRVLVRLQRLLAPEPAALFRLLNKPPAWIGEADVQDMREAAEEFSAAVGDSVSLVERIKLLQEEIAALVTEQTNRTLFVLTMVTVIALPINLIAGLMGMNVGGIPFAEYRHGFAVVVGFVALFTCVLGYLALGRRRK